MTGGDEFPWHDRTDVIVPPRTIAGKYKLGRLLGEGGMGAVYEAEHVGLGAKVAIKLLSERFVADPKSLMRFRREARASAAVRHRNVVSVFDTGTDEEGVPFIVMELLEGESLAAILRRARTLPFEDAVAITCQVLSGLGAAHARGVIHRDLKPANIYVARGSEGQYAVKILDFGISKFATELRSMEVTADGALIGTPQFMAPEQIQRRKDIDARTDLYAVGVLLYRMLTGRMPFVAGEAKSLMQAVLQGSPKAPREYREDISEELEEVILCAMAPDRDTRFSSAREFAQALMALYPQLPRYGELDQPITQSITAPEDLLRSPVEGRASNIRRPWALALAAFTALGAVGLILVARRSEVPTAAEERRTVLTERAGSDDPKAGALPQTLRLGITRYLPKELVLRNMTPLSSFLSSKLDRRIEIVVVEDYLDLAGELVTGKLDVAALSGYAYVRAKRDAPALTLLATPMTRAGATYEGYVLTRADGGVHSLLDLRDRVFCYVSPNSTSGYLYPRALFRRAGIDPDADFRATRFTGDHLSALRALDTGACDGTVVYANILFDAAKYNMTPETFRILASTDRIPFDAYTARDGLPATFIADLKAALLLLSPGSDDAVAVFGEASKIIGFTSARDSDYDAVRDIEAYLDTPAQAPAPAVATGTE